MYVHSFVAKANVIKYTFEQMGYIIKRIELPVDLHDIVLHNDNVYVCKVKSDFEIHLEESVSVCVCGCNLCSFSDMS